MVLAWAAIELSMISATAVFRLYPTDRIDSKRFGSGVQSTISNLPDIFVEC